MTYATQADYIAAFGEAELGQLTLDDPAVFDAAQQRASAVIDGYLAARYSLPLSSTPDLVRGWCLDLMRHALHKDFASEQVAERRDTALQQLRDLSKGAMVLKIEGATPPQQLAFEGYSAPRRFTADKLAGFVS